MPERFAALAAVCGGGDETKADRLAKLPIWAWHGDDDQAVPVERSRRMIAAIQRAGGKPKYTELPGVGHDSWTPAYNGPDNLLAWLFAQSKQSAARQVAPARSEGRSSLRRLAQVDPKPPPACWTQLRADRPV